MATSPKDKAARYQAAQYRDGLYAKQGGLCAVCGGSVQRRGRQYRAPGKRRERPAPQPATALQAVQSAQGSVVTAFSRYWNSNNGRHAAL